MLKIKNASGEELLTLKDDGTEEIHDRKLKEEYEAAETNEDKGE